MSMDMNMNQDKPRVYWRKNQVYLRFPFTLPVSSSADDVNKQVQEHLSKLNTALTDTQLQLAPLGGQVAPQERVSPHEVAAQQTTNNEKLLNGVYLFPLPPPPTVHGSRREQPMNEIAGVFQIVPPTPTGTMHEMAAMKSPDTPDHTLDVIAQLNKTNQANESPTPAIPNMLWSACNGAGPNGGQTHGCPVCPPIPVEGSAGQWHIMMPTIPQALQNATGKGVTVFVLDTLPPQQQILDAAKNAGNNNQLLQSLANPSSFNYDYLSDDEAANPQELVSTGKDITGKLVGFPMQDHGMFVAGIVHDLAPQAKIECIRVLNNYGVGDLNTLAAALSDILFRISSGGDLDQQSVVINLSLLVMPPGNDIPPEFTPEIRQHARHELSQLLGQLIGNGVVIVASAGNDSDPRDTMMNPKGVRYEARYPAYFAYDPQYPLPDLIPVGAFNEQGQAASYSNYPGPQGIATYGGEIPTIISQDNPSDIIIAMPPDALRGVYTSPYYPALSYDAQSPTMTPLLYPENPAPNAYDWAYWSGTSFATPIISALAARALENQPALSGSEVRQAIIDGAPQLQWPNLEDGTTGSTPMIQVVQSMQQPTQPQQAQSARP